MVTTGVLTLPNDNTDTGEFTSNSPLTPSRPTIPADSHCMQSYTRTPVLHTDETITSARSVRPEHWIKFRRRNPRPCGRCKKQKVRCEVTAPYSPELCGNCKTHGLTTCHTSQPDTGGRQLQRRRRRRNVYPSSSTALDDTNGGMTSESRHLPVARSSFAPWSPLPQSSSGLQSLAETQHSHPSSTGWMAANPIFSTHETDIQPTDIENLFPSERPYPYVSTLRAAPNPIFSAIQTEIPPRAIRNPQFLSETSHTSHTSHASSTGGTARSPMDNAFQTEFQPTTSGFGDVSRRPYVGQHTSASLRATSPLMQPFYFPWPYRTGSPDPTRGIAPSEPTPSPIHMASESAGPSQPRLTPKDAPDS
ncbi:hypothetical protein BD410DRAFT_307792 [Rickenella mellea]|uniref:Zn(2)-C6 fungal-type domain-containing protein n=1 Tax=Rickenella mellea TaxID=50990 RepID=A0A4Y7Q0N1_9AGAM|nr:hypothetical protein BD410DRAFT_307792 [Rickenella mellea]